MPQVLDQFHSYPFICGDKKWTDGRDMYDMFVEDLDDEIAANADVQFPKEVSPDEVESRIENMKAWLKEMGGEKAKGIGLCALHAKARSCVFETNFKRIHKASTST